MNALTKMVAVAVAVLVLVFAAGYFTGKGRGAHEHPSASEAVDNEAKPLFWTCSMHPQIRQPESGLCPICNMELIPVYPDAESADTGPRELKLSATAQKIAGIQVSPVERKFVDVEVRMVGKVEFDETRLAHITAWVGGRLDRLYVDYTGITVKKGDHLVWLYSPELLSAQEELLQAIKAVRELEHSNLESVKHTALKTVDATREKLRLWGLTKEQVKEIEQRGKPSDHVTIYAPVGGIVIEKHGVEGMYVKTGMRIYTIADLSQVWVKLDAYEPDLAWVRYGQKVEFQSEAYPGETFKGRVSFVAPVLNEKTRTVKVRVNVPNPEGKLKPGMFVRAGISVRSNAEGKVIGTDLAGKWLCPMHHEVVKNEAGKCDICEMPLVRAETIGFAAAVEATPPLVIPASAPLITGQRAVVYVKVPDKEGVFEGREIVLGPRAGDYYVVKKGLQEGEEVVTKGNFKIDSALQIMAKPSMMSPESGAPPPGHHHGDNTTTAPAAPTLFAEKQFDVPERFRKQLDHVIEAYLQIQRSLAGDDLDGGVSVAKGLLAALGGVDMMLLEEPAHTAWMKELSALTSSAKSLSTSKDITSARKAFLTLSQTVINVAQRFGTIPGRALYQFHCPMAFDNTGGDWLAGEREVANPYFGTEMLGCGEMVEDLSSQHGKR